MLGDMTHNYADMFLYLQDKLVKYACNFCVTACIQTWVTTIMVSLTPTNTKNVHSSI